MHINLVALIKIFALFWLATPLAQAVTTEPLHLQALPQGQSAAGHLSFLRDARGALTLEEVRQRAFEPLKAQTGFGFDLAAPGSRDG